MVDQPFPKNLRKNLLLCECRWAVSGELTGLTWDDIDLNSSRLGINKTIQYAYGEIHEKGTKTVNSERVNYVSGMTLDILKQ